MNKYGKITVITSGLILPITLILGSVVTWYLKTNNPDGVDITAGLAYLRPTLLTSFITFGVLWAVSLVGGLLGLKRDQSNELSKIGLILLVLVTVTSIGAGVATKGVSDAEDAYREQQSREFFQKLQE